MEVGSGFKYSKPDTDPKKVNQMCNTDQKLSDVFFILKYFFATAKTLGKPTNKKSNRGLKES